MKFDLIAKIVAGLLSIYFIASGLDALFNIDAKLERIGLSAVSEDGKIAFILIYSGLMTGIGVAMAVLGLFFKSATSPLILAATILTSFIAFRFIGSTMLGSLSGTQLGYIATEFVELSIVFLALYKSNTKH